MDHKFPYADIQHQQYFSDEGGKCIQCGTGIPEPGYPNKLCAGCREMYIRYPVPKWIWAFGAGILVLVVLGFFRSARFLGHARHMARAEKAMEAHKYVTAAKELEPVLAKFPDRVDANTMMFIASVYNHDPERLQQAFEKIKDLEIADKILFRQAEEATEYAAQFFSVDTAFLSRCLILKDSLPALQKLAAEVDTSNTITHKPAAYYIVANQLFDHKAFDLCETLVQKTLAEEPDNYGAQLLLAAIWRDTGRGNKATALLEKLLQQNREDLYVLSLLSRIELKQFHDKQAAGFARQAIELDPGNCMALEAQAMVDLYAGKKGKSNQLLAQIRKTEAATGQDSEISDRLHKYISGKESFR